MTYHHLWHRVHLSLSRSQAPVLLWTFNDQLLLWSFTSPSLHCQQLWWDFSALDPKEKRAASISNREKSWCWERSLHSHRLLLTPSFLRLLCLSESSGLTPRLRRWWPLLHSAVQPGGVKHPHTHTHAHIHTHNEAIWPHIIHLHGDTGLTKANKRHTFLKYYSLVGDRPRLMRDSWNKSWF